MVGTFNVMKDAILGRRGGRPPHVFRSFYFDAVILRPVRQKVRHGKARNGMGVHVFQSVQQGHGGPQFIRCPRATDIHGAQSGMRAHGQDFGIFPNPIGRNRIGHEKGDPLGKQRGQEVPQRVRDGPRR
eukprot:scaffold34758_cov214-Amphora_coffeaeformis.AAC.2